jgi:hypothetical protein
VQRIWIFVMAFAVFGAAIVVPALAGNVIIGVNTVGVQQMSEPQQDALIEALQQNGVKTVRTGIGKFAHFIIRAYQHGIGALVIVYPTHASTNGQPRPADPSVGLQWAERGITNADPEKFKALLAAELATLEAAGVHLAALELGNEINGPFFNGDFLPAEASGRMLGLSDLDNPNDPEGRAIAASYHAYLKVIAALKDVRDHSQLNQKTPIISAGLAAAGLPGKRPGQKLDGVSVPATLAFLRRNGMDNLVDGYGVHVYPGGDPTTLLSARIDSLAKDAFAMCTAGKPCWLTEWGFGNHDQSCPVNDEMRKQLIETERSAFKQFAGQGRLAATMYYSWTAEPWAKQVDPLSIYRCGGLTSAGKLALSPL